MKKHYSKSPKVTCIRILPEFNHLWRNKIFGTHYVFKIFPDLIWIWNVSNLWWIDTRDGTDVGYTWNITHCWIERVWGVLSRTHLLSSPKIGDSNLPVLIQYNICRLKISVNNIMLSQEYQSITDLSSKILWKLERYDL